MRIIESNKNLHSTAYPLRKLPYRFAPFYGNFRSAYTASEVGVIRVKNSDMNNNTQSPIFDTQQKFKEAAYFLKTCAKHYHEPDVFQFNLNAFIQSLRNITFMLQSTSYKPDGFDLWYENKQAEMRANDLLRRFVKARNTVVKQSSLKTHSTARSGVFSGRHLKLGMKHSVPVFAPSSWVLERLEARVGFYLDENRSQAWEQFGIYRVWVVEELGVQEVLGLCVNALNHIGEVVSSAQELFGVEGECTVVYVDMLQTQTLLETDVDPSRIVKWGWNNMV